MGSHKTVETSKPGAGHLRSTLRALSQKMVGVYTVIKAFSDLEIVQFIASKKSGYS